MARSCMHLWQSCSPLLINWYTKLAAQCADNAHFCLQHTGMRWRYQSMHTVKWHFYLYNWYHFEAINFFVTHIIQLYLPNRILSPHKLICPSTTWLNQGNTSLSRHCQARCGSSFIYIYHMFIILNMQISSVSHVFDGCMASHSLF